MNELPSDNLPPELDELGQRMSKERPVASDPALDRVMTRAQSARRPRKSLLWRSTAPRAGRRSIAAVVAGVMAMAGMTGVAVLGASADDSVNPTALNSVVTPVADCPEGTIKVDLPDLLCAVVIPDGACPEGSVQVDLPGVVCVVVGPVTPGSGDPGAVCSEGQIEVNLPNLLCATLVEDPDAVCPQGAIRVDLGGNLACIVAGVNGTSILGGGDGGGGDATGGIPIVSDLLNSIGGLFG